MSQPPKILAFAGSTRTDSYNKKLIRIAAATAQEAGAEVTLVDLRDYPMPLYDGDLESESGLPENAKRLKQLLKEHDALLISAPEYNSSHSAVLKNTIDWMSRAEPGDVEPSVFQHKTAALLSASPGSLGGLRGLSHLRAVLNHLDVLVISSQFAVPRAFEAFDDEGQFINEAQRSSLAKLTRELVEITQRLRRD